MNPLRHKKVSYWWYQCVQLFILYIHIYIYTFFSIQLMFVYMYIFLYVNETKNIYLFIKDAWHFSCKLFKINVILVERNNRYWKKGLYKVNILIVNIFECFNGWIPEWTLEYMKSLPNYLRKIAEKEEENFHKNFLINHISKSIGYGHRYLVQTYK